jgi:hypothetical protein
MSNLILFPATRENLFTSVIKSVSLGYAGEYLTPQTFAQLEQVVGEKGKFYWWAVTKERKSIFHKAQANDDVLFAENGSGLFSLWTKIIYKLHSSPFGNHLWTISSKLPWEYIFILRESKGISVNKKSLLTKLGFAADFWLPGAVMVNQDNYVKALKQVGGLSQLIC